MEGILEYYTVLQGRTLTLWCIQASCAFCRECFSKIATKFSTAIERVCVWIDGNVDPFHRPCAPNYPTAPCAHISHLAAGSLCSCRRPNPNGFGFLYSPSNDTATTSMTQVATPVTWV
eukprot:COSAG02_NODE_5030_length_4715_cov_3.115035_4_plen_118_part_00